MKEDIYENKWDKLLKIHTMGRDDSNAGQYYYPYEPTPYSVLERLANTGIIRKGNTLLDYGCGKGRVDFFLAYQTRCRSIGVEYDERIYNKAIENKEKTIIYGDYDVDGITSITVLKSFLEDRGLHVDSYIPNRLEEGYGLNKPAIDYIVKEKYTLMITVDTGISGIEEIEYANSLGIETIVTDHHEVGEELPKALAVVDAKRKDNQYPCRDLAGVGVVFKLIQALRKKTRIR